MGYPVWRNCSTGTEWERFPRWKRTIWLQAVKFSHNNDDLPSGWSTCHSNVVRIFTGQSSLAQCLRQGNIKCDDGFIKSWAVSHNMIIYLLFVKWFSFFWLSTLIMVVQDSFATHIVRDERMTRTSFVANVGGLLGLCMGFSLVKMKAKITKWCTRLRVSILSTIYLHFAGFYTCPNNTKCDYIIIKQESLVT